MEKKQHSVPVPRLYKEASKILKRYENKEGSLKTLVYNSNYRNYGKIHGLLCKAVQNSTTIKRALALSELFVEQPKFDPYLAQVLTTDLLLKRMPLGNCKPIEVLRKYEEKIKKVAGPNIEEQFSHNEKNDCCPRYVRVNTLKTSMDRVQAQLASQGWMFLEYNPLQETYDDFLNVIQNMDESTYLRDYHVPELLVFPPNTTFWDNILYKKNAIILQDKSSCLPVFVSSIQSGAKVIDACAAPGSKTSYIAGILNNTGHVLATEMDSSRFETLVKLLRQRGVTCVTTYKQDFMELPHNKFPGVEYIFVDPTCSSSGVNVYKYEVSQQRIKSLASFQVRTLLYALSFPSVKEVIYSTCSVHAEENEEVVEEALNQYHDHFKLENLGKKLPEWKHFGNTKYSCGKKCLRTNTEIDKCQGFFIAKFVRRNNKDCDKLHSDNCKGQKRKHSSCSNSQNKEELEQCMDGKNGFISEGNDVSGTELIDHDNTHKRKRKSKKIMGEKMKSKNCDKQKNHEKNQKKS